MSGLLTGRCAAVAAGLAALAGRLHVFRGLAPGRRPQLPLHTAAQGALRLHGVAR
jgi:hypothetical protein